MQGVATPENRIIEALGRAKGSVSAAAAELGYTRSSLHTRISGSETLKAALAEYREARIDRVEVKLQDLADEGNIAALIFLAKTLGRERGYSEQPIVLAPPQINVAVVGDWRRPDAPQVVIETPSQPELPPGDQ